MPRGRARRGRGIGVVGLVLALCLLVLAAPAPRGAGSWTGPAAAATGAELPLVVEGDTVRVYSSDSSGQHLDPWVVWVCHVDPGGSVPERLPLTPADVVTELEARIAPYFEWLSGGAYRPTFTAGGSIDSGSDDPATAIQNCNAPATTSPMSAGFAGAVVIADAPTDGGYGQSGHGNCASPPCPAPTTLPDNQRYLDLGAHDLFATTTVGTPRLAETAHEFGHTLDWGHAGPAVEYQVYEPEQPGYQPTAGDAPWLDDTVPALFASLDPFLTTHGLPTIEADRTALGSASVDCASVPPAGPGHSLCLLLRLLPYGDVYDLMGPDPSLLTPDTLALPQSQVFNRYAAGWLDDDEIEVHPGGFGEYVLAPIDVAGTQMLVLPGSDPERFVTIEARRATPFFPGGVNDGVQVHLVDQGPVAEGGPLCWGDCDWKTTVQGGSPWSLNQMLGPGGTVVVDGEPVEVVSANAEGTYTIRIGNPPEGPSTTIDSSTTAPASPAVVVARPTFTG